MFKHDSESISVHHSWFQDGLIKPGLSYAHAASVEIKAKSSVFEADWQYYIILKHFSSTGARFVPNLMM